MTEVGHGQEASEEGEEVREEEEESSGTADRGEAIRKAGRRKEEGGSQGHDAQESERSQAPGAGDADGRAAGAGRGTGRYAVDGGNPRGQDGAEPGGGLAVSDGIPALMGAE